MTTENPTILVPDTACAFFGSGEIEELCSEIRGQIPDIDIEIAYTRTESRSGIDGVDIVLTHELPDELLELAENLQWVQALSAGVDMYDIDRLHDRGVILTNVSGVHSQPITEQVFGYMFLFERDILRGLRQQERASWEQYGAGELYGQTLGIIGVGAIGSRIAEVGEAVGMDVLGTKRDLESGPDAVDELYPPDDLSEVLKRADYLVISCPLTDETHHLIGERDGILKTSSVIINIARGAIIDESALEFALQQGRIGGAALDVFEEEPLPATSPLWDLSSVIVTPQMAGWTDRMWGRVADIFTENYYNYLADDELLNTIE
jgi:phosphoglycerate dehydrogenase-like enzyme